MGYTAFRLQNPIAAETCVDAVEAAIMHREHPYDTIPVKNFYVFYVVIGDVMEVRTLLYSRRDLVNII